MTALASRSSALSATHGNGPSNSAASAAHPNMMQFMGGASAGAGAGALGDGSMMLGMNQSGVNYRHGQQVEATAAALQHLGLYHVLATYLSVNDTSASAPTPFRHPGLPQMPLQSSALSSLPMSVAPTTTPNAPRNSKT